MSNLRIISGGQTGIDRAALDVALSLKMSSGGWCPKGRLAEDGVIDAKYPLKETPTENYKERTEWNVRDSDGTLILTQGEPTGGTKLTIQLAVRLQKPCFIVFLNQDQEADEFYAWMKEYKIKTLNVAGPRKSSQPNLYDRAYKFLRKVLKNL